MIPEHIEKQRSNSEMLRFVSLTLPTKYSKNVVMFFVQEMCQTSTGKNVIGKEENFCKPYFAGNIFSQ